LAELKEVATVGDSVVFLVPDPQLVLPLSVQPIVIDGAGGTNNKWEDLGMQWFKNANEAFPRVAASGPSDWQHIAPNGNVSGLDRLPKTNVTNVDVNDKTISFDVDQVGKPILIRVSDFPWWKAQGAQGPYRIAPNWMVVVPTSTHVELVQRVQLV